ncbi:MAG: hypothetical protein VX617_05710 [Pseudomonadota bacterium]|nr:hypothetical protein [Pseudomonadota bacterium]
MFNIKVIAFCLAWFFYAIPISETTKVVAAEKPAMSPDAKPVEYDPGAFSPDPSYKDKKYDALKQIEIYGGKSRFDEIRPLLELGRPIYLEGPFKKGLNLFGRKNPMYPGLHVYGDWRTAVGFNDNGNNENGLIATRLNLDIDFRLTGTERLHALIQPLDNDGVFTKHEFSGDNDQGFERSTDLNLETLFFEGDLGAIAAGLADEYNSLDLPITFGLVPLLFQNGIWLDDAFIGGAFSIPALHSTSLAISNMDITFFGGFDKVTTPAITDDNGELADKNINLYGLTTFIEANEGYWEAGFGRIDGEDGFGDFSYNSATLAFTKRYGGWLSNSLRGFVTFGQDPDNNEQQTADGLIFLAENSLITSKPSTFVPYGNFWLGLDRPQPLADATGLLKNTGITFETNGLTGLPKLDDTGHDTFGGAIGLQYLFNLDQQIVVEGSTVQIMGDPNDLGRAAADDQYGIGFRYQLPISKAWIFRADAMYGFLDNTDDIAGVSFEIRVKF